MQLQNTASSWRLEGKRKEGPCSMGRRSERGCPLQEETQQLMDPPAPKSCPALADVVRTSATWAFTTASTAAEHPLLMPAVGTNPLFSTSDVYGIPGFILRECIALKPVYQYS